MNKYQVELSDNGKAELELLRKKLGLDEVHDKIISSQILTDRLNAEHDLDEKKINNGLGRRYGYHRNDRNHNNNETGEKDE